MHVEPISTGTRIGKLMILGVDGRDDLFRRKMRCRCDCGNEVIVYEFNLKRSHTHTRSCGCHRKEVLSRGSKNSISHGETCGGKDSKEYLAWIGMRVRCHDESSPGWSNYGGRGIVVCERWKDSFSQFLDDMGRAPSSKHSVDRIDNQGNYEPGNCRWATVEQQQRNRRNNRLVTHEGLTLSIIEWVERTGISHQTIRNRLKHGWTIQRTLTEPMRAYPRGL